MYLTDDKDAKALGQGHRGGKVGSLGWARQTQGRLRPQDRLRLLGQGVRGQLPLILGLLGGRLGIRPRRRATADIGDLPTSPDTAAARDAEQLCDEQRPEMLVNHCYRTFLWATILAAHQGLGYDEELLYISSLMHDLGLSERGDSRPKPSCFTLVGAASCEEVGDRHGWEEIRREQAAEAVTLHMNLRVRPEDGVEAYLITAGAQLDVIGARFWKLHPNTVAAVLARYPRNAVKQGMVDLFGNEARQNRGSRASFYYRYLGLPLLMRLAPFEE
jgi:hypothetical protein